MQECIASWAHLFANFSWWGCLMIVVAGVQSDVYHHKVKVVSPRKICKAPSNRAKCTKCKANIEAGELRIELLHYWSTVCGQFFPAKSSRASTQRQK